MQRIAIVTDSTADLPEELAARLDIHVIPNILVINGQELEDGKGITRQQFYENLPWMQPLPTTATASSGTYQQLYENLFQQGFSQVISIHASSLLSGIFNAASLAAQNFGTRVHVVDSQNISLGLGFQVLAAAEAALTAPVENILQKLDDLRKHIHVVAMLDTLEYIRRSGRVSWARARLGELLRIKPFVEVRAGQVFSLGETRTRRNGIERLMKILNGLGALDRLALLHTNAEADARAFHTALNPDLTAPALFVNVTTVIGTHVGPNGLGFAAVLRW
jgi:DegV family protein with EDD domain